MQIDWAAVAGQLGITNGHAARMRFSRFKQAMEGVVPAPRKRAGVSGARPRRVKTEKTGKVENEKKNCMENIKTEVREAQEPSVETATTTTTTTTTVTTPFAVKSEPVDAMDTPGMTGLAAAVLSPTADAFRGVAKLDPALLDQDPFTSCSGPSVSVPVHTLPGPSRKDFGPFAGTYPPPGVTLPLSQPTLQLQQLQPSQQQGQEQEQRQQQQPAEPLSSSPSSVTVIKQEPRWEV